MLLAERPSCLLLIAGVHGLLHEFHVGTALATTAATASAELGREAQRIGAAAGRPVPPDTEPAAGDAAYRTAWRLSAASFQEMTRVLTEAAINLKSDKLAA